MPHSTMRTGMGRNKHAIILTQRFSRKVAENTKNPISFVLVVLVVLVVVAVVRVAVGVVFVRSRFRRLANSVQSFSGALRRPVHLSHLLHLLNV